MKPATLHRQKTSSFDTGSDEASGGYLGGMRRRFHRWSKPSGGQAEETHDQDGDANAQAASAHDNAPGIKDRILAGVKKGVSSALDRAERTKDWIKSAGSRRGRSDSESDKHSTTAAAVQRDALPKTAASNTHDTEIDAEAGAGTTEQQSPASTEVSRPLRRQNVLPSREFQKLERERKEKESMDKQRLEAFERARQAARSQSVEAVFPTVGVPGQTLVGERTTEPGPVSIVGEKALVPQELDEMKKDFPKEVSDRVTRYSPYQETRVDVIAVQAGEPPLAPLVGLMRRVMTWNNLGYPYTRAIAWAAIRRASDIKYTEFDTHVHDSSSDAAELYYTQEALASMAPSSPVTVQVSAEEDLMAYRCTEDSAHSALIVAVSVLRDQIAEHFGALADPADPDSRIYIYNDCVRGRTSSCGILGNVMLLSNSGPNACERFILERFIIDHPNLQVSLAYTQTNRLETNPRQDVGGMRGMTKLFGADPECAGALVVDPRAAHPGRSTENVWIWSPKANWCKYSVSFCRTMCTAAPPKLLNQKKRINTKAVMRLSYCHRSEWEPGGDSRQSDAVRALNQLRGYNIRAAGKALALNKARSTRAKLLSLTGRGLGDKGSFGNVWENDRHIYAQMSPLERKKNEQIKYEGSILPFERFPSFDISTLELQRCRCKRLPGSECEMLEDQLERDEYIRQQQEKLKQREHEKLQMLMAQDAASSDNDNAAGAAAGEGDMSPAAAATEAVVAPGRHS